MKLGFTCLITLGLLLTSQASDAPKSFDALFQPDLTFPYFETVNVWPDSPANDRWSVSRAAVLAQLSTLVYVPDPTSVREAATKAGFRKARFIESGDSQVWVFESDQLSAVVFRGTEPGNTEDLFTDLQFLPTDYVDGVQAHAGFVQAIKAVTTELDACLPTAPSKPIWLAGHSLGGALAQLYGWHQRDRIAGVYAFGSPRVFTARLRDDAGAAFPCFRIVNNNDVVPHLPTPPVYAHSGEEWFIDENGDLLRDPSFKDKLSAAWQGHRNYAARWFADWRETHDLRLVPGDALADHAPSNYARALIAATQSP